MFKVLEQFRSDFSMPTNNFGWNCSFILTVWLKWLDDSWENLFSKRYADYFRHISWTWNLFQRPQCVQGNVELTTWRRTKCAHKTKQLCRQTCGHCWKRHNSFQTFDKTSVGKICKDYLISFEMTITRTVLLKYLAKYAILRMSP